VPLIFNYFSDWLKGNELLLLENLIRILNSYGWVLVAIATGIGAFWVYELLREMRNDFTKIWEFYKPIDKLTPKDFKIQKYRKSHILRKSDATIENFLRNRKHVLINGKPKIGKTRASYEAIKKLENFSVIKPRAEEIEIERIMIPPFSNKNFILLLDDLQRFVDKNIEDVINVLKKKSKQLIIVATCRDGDELNLVKENNLTLYREFIYIEIEKISKDDCNRLVEDIKNEDRKFEWNVKLFDGTPGCVTLDLEDMKERYRKAGDSKVIMKALKLLNEGNIFVYKETRVKDICRDVFELSNNLLTRNIWDEMIINLKEQGFITRDKDIIDVYPSYLDFCVYDYDPRLNDLMKLRDMLVRSHDSGSLFYLANGFLYKKDFNRARHCYMEALKIYPEYASAHASLGYVLSKLGEELEGKGLYYKAERLFKEAQEESRRAISINPNYSIDYNNLGYSLSKLGVLKERLGERVEATRLLVEAEWAAKEAVRLNPNSSSAHRSLGYTLEKLGKYEDAENELRESITLDPESPFSYNLLGHMLVKLERYEDAEKEYKKAIRIKPDYPSARNNLGYLLTNQGRYSEAEKEYREALKASPNYIVAYVNLTQLLSNIKRYDEAVKVCKKALDINPNYAEAHCSLGYALVNLNRYEEAEQEYTKAIYIKPSFAAAHKNLGYLMTKVGRYDEAETAYKAALKINQNDEDTMIGLGITLEKSGKNQAAEKYYMKVIQISPNNIKARTTYAYFLSYRDRPEEAIKQFKEILKISPDNIRALKQLQYYNNERPYLRSNRAKALAQLGKFDEAESEAKKAVKLSPNFPFAHKNLGTILEERGDKANTENKKIMLYEDAEKEYREAIRLKPYYPSAHRHLANTLVKLGRYEEAENEYYETKKAVRDYPNNNRDFGIFLSKLGRKENAAREFKIAIKLFREQGKEKDAMKVEELLKA